MLIRAISLLILLTLSGCGGGNPIMRNIVRDLGITPPPLPAPGDTIAGAVVQKDALNLLLARDATLIKTCKAYGLVNTEVTEPPRVVGGKWVERWTLDRCGTPVKYDLEFYPDGRGGTRFGINGPIE